MVLGLRALGVASALLTLSALAACSAFNGSDKQAAASVDAGIADATVIHDDAGIGPTFCAGQAYSLCMDFDDGVLVPKPFTQGGDDGVLSIFTGLGSSLWVNASPVADTSGRTAELVATVPVPAKVTFGFTLTLKDTNPQPNHMEIVGFEVQSAAKPYVFVAIENANLTIQEASGNILPNIMSTQQLPPALTPVRYEVVFTLGATNDVAIAKDGQPIPAKQPAAFASLPTDATSIKCSAGMHYRYTPTNGSSILLDDVYFTF